MSYNADMLMNSTSQSSYKPSFGAIKLRDKNTRRMVIQELSYHHLLEFNEILRAQENNPVHALLYSSKDKNKLRAIIICPFKLPDCEKFYKQKFLFESRFAFILRVTKQLNKYRDQLVSGGFI